MAVPENGTRLEIEVTSQNALPLEFYWRFGNRVIIHLGRAYADGVFKVEDGPMVFEGDSLQEGTYFFASRNCQAIDQRYDFMSRLSVETPNVKTIDVLLRETGLVEPAPPLAEATLFPRQYILEVEDPGSEVVFAAWGDVCADKDVDLLVARDQLVTLEPDGTSNALWRSESRGEGGETLNLGRPGPGSYYAAVVNRSPTTTEFRLGATLRSEQTFGLPLTAAATGIAVGNAGQPTNIFQVTQYEVVVPPGAETFTASLSHSGEAGDLRFYLRYALPTVLTGDGGLLTELRSQTLAEGAEIIRIGVGGCLRPGSYHFGIANYVAENLSYRFTTTVDGSCLNLELGGSLTSVTLPDVQYCLEVPAGSLGFQAVLDSDAPLDLFIRKDAPVEQGIGAPPADYASATIGGVESITVPRSRVSGGTYYVGLASALSEQQAFTLSTIELKETRRVLALGSSQTALAEASPLDGIGRLASAQYVLDVPADSAALQIVLSTETAGSAFALHVRHGARVEILGQIPQATWSDPTEGRRQVVLLREPAAGEYFISVENSRAALTRFRIEATETGSALPGDCDGNGTLDLSDATCMLGDLFVEPNQNLPCSQGQSSDESDVDHLNWNGDDVFDISDVVGLLTWKFLSGPSHAMGSDCTPITDCRASCVAG